LLPLVSDTDEVVRKRFDSIDAGIGLDAIRMVGKQNSLLGFDYNQSFLVLKFFISVSFPQQEIFQ